ncbi:MAG: FAD-binding oxidoreductase [Nitrososphaerales archaeon]|nr:FAD-binding oxidoreductase [Nitrososphaerales archaeon]
MKILASADDLDELSRDAGFIVKRPAAAYVAETEEDVLTVLRSASQLGLSVTPRGSGTSIPSQAVGSGYVLLQNARRADLSDPGTISCDPALVKADLNAALDPLGVWMPVDPSSYKSCSVGGMVSNNASGARTYKYGSTIDYVQELRVVLPEEGLKVVKPVGIEEALHSGGSTAKVSSLLIENGKAIRDDSPKVTKNSSGYRLEKIIHDGMVDLPRLFVGSEGTLAVTTKIRLATRPKPVERLLIVIETSLAELDKVAAALREHGPSAVELVDKSVFRQTGREERIKSLSRTEEDYLVFCEFDGLVRGETSRNLEEVARDKTLVQFDPVVLEDAAEVSRAWEVRNETLTIAGEIRRGSRVPLPGVEDLVVPPQLLGTMVRLLRDSFESRGLEYISYGHAGDANLHMRPLLDPGSSSDVSLLREIMDECFEAVWKMGGSITGEHGDGLLRAPFVERQYRRTYWIMKEVKKLYDPKNLLNPGVKVT